MAKKRYFLAFFCCFPNLNPKSFRFLTIYSPLLMLSSLKNRCLLKRLLVFQKKTGLYKGKVCCYSRLDSARLEAQKLGSPKARWFASSARQKLGNDQARTSLKTVPIIHGSKFHKTLASGKKQTYYLVEGLR